MRANADQDLDGFVEWLETRPYSPSTRISMFRRARTCFDAGVTRAEDVDDVFVHRSISRRYRTSLRNALRTYAEFEAVAA
jgi:hypothetical protein